MKTIDENVKIEIVVNKSRFITYLKKIEKEDDVLNTIDEIKELNKGANHYCYAYRLINSEKANDDKEPSGSAGVPILSVLKQKDLYNVLCVVVRYFGGIKLGIGGLIRAYRNSTNEAINKTNIIKYEQMIKKKIVFDYDRENDINKLINKDYIINKLYEEKITYNLNIPVDLWSKIKDRI